MRSLSTLYLWLRLISIASTLLSGSYGSVELAERGVCCGKCCAGDASDADDGGGCAFDPVDGADEATVDGIPGIGFELECGQIQLSPERGGCTEEQIAQSKGHIIGGRTGTNWELTADTTLGDVLDVEYILNGKTIKLGSGDLQTAAKAVHDDLAAWNPHKIMMSNSFAIDQSECNNWKVIEPLMSGSFSMCSFSLQATAPFPLEAIYDLMGKALRGEQSVLKPDRTPQGTTLVTKAFFQALSPPGGLSPDSLKDDILGFLSIVVSYAKVDKDEKNFPSESIKDTLSIMPRNDFSSIFQLLKQSGSMPEYKGFLWDLVVGLSCFKNEKDSVVFDTEFCDGDAKNPKAKAGKLEGMIYKRQNDMCTMKEWIDAIEAGTTPDPISRVDQQVDGSVGRFGSTFESVLNTDRRVPIFEFRRLPSSKPKDFGARAQAVEDAIVAYHEQFANAPRRLRRRQNLEFSHIKRNAATNSCLVATQTSASSMITPAPAVPSCLVQEIDPDIGINQQGCICGTMTLPRLTGPDIHDESQACAYTTMPTTSVPNPITRQTQTYTSNCYLCNWVDGFADTPTCATTPVGGCTPTTPAVPTATVFLSNNSVPIGDENNKNGGADLRNSLYQQLQKLCPDNANTCDSKKPAEFDNIPTVQGNEMEEETLKFVVQDSHYDSPKERDRLIAAAVAIWQQAVAKSCKQVEYEEPADDTGKGCGAGIVKRIVDAPRPNTPMCKYTATICAGPDHINPLLGNQINGPYANHMNIQLTSELKKPAAFNFFDCELIIDGLTALAMAVAPELAGADIWEDLELQSLCQGVADTIGSRDANITYLASS